MIRLNCRAIAVVASLSAVALQFVTETQAVAAAGAEKPNVILIMTDDQGYGDVACHGNTMIKTPNMDALYRQSVRLTDFHVDPTCSPTRSALMTGRYSTRTGVWHTIMGRSLMDPREVTLGEMFMAGGYRTAMFGKWHLGDNYPSRAQDQGFDEVFCHRGGGVGQGPDYWGNNYFDDTYLHNGKPETVTGYCTDVWFAGALDFIRKNKDRPFFVYLATNAPHAPYLVADKYSKPYRDRGVPKTMANFYGMITNLDENLGLLMRKLEQWDLAENTILIFMSDNGSAAGWQATRGEQGTWPGYNAGMREGKGSEYDGGHRVPFFIRWPEGGIDSGRDVAQLSAHIDVLPTLAELCRIEKPEGPPIDGVSLVPLLSGRAVSLGPRTLLVHSQRIPTPKKWRKCAAMTDRWRLVDGTELYDVKADPGQQTDVADEHPQVVQRLRAVYEDWWTSLSSVFDDCVYIGIGTDAEPCPRLNAHDWHVASQSMSPWSQVLIKQGLMGNGFWAIDVMRRGRYQFELRRWPREVNGPIEATEARLQIAGVDVRQSVSADDTKVVFDVDLQPGKTRLLTTLKLKDGKERGAYFVYVRRLE